MSENESPPGSESRFGIGGNAPPELLEAFDPKPLGEASLLERIRARVTARHKAVFDRMAELTASFHTFPEVFPNDEIQGQAADLFKMMRTVRSRADEFRKLETEPFRMIRAMIDDVFGGPSDALEIHQKTLKGRIDKFAEQKKEREKAERESIARREREEAQRKLEEAAAAELRERQERIRAEAAAKAEREAAERKDREERAARAALERKRRITKIQPYLQRRAKREADRKELEQAERQRLAQEARDRAAAAIAAEEKNRREAKDRAAEARKDERDARADAKEATADADQSAKDQVVGMRTAIKQDARADRADVRANASAADMSRTRGRFGTVASLSTRWVVKSVDHDRVDLNALRGLITTDAVEAAAFKYLQLHRTEPGGPKLDGVEFEQIEDARMV